ncbi:MAG: glycoside hydrolase family 38 C-terminal domain-containing protein [Pseudomonadota bacterium]
MNHKERFTAQKIAQRLALIEPALFRRADPINPFRMIALPNAKVEPPLHEDPSGWDLIPHESYWGKCDLNFCMKSRFQVPSDWRGEGLCLHLPLGNSGDIFTHPEALVYIDGRPIGSADRYHHTIPLPGELADGRPHDIALHGWTGWSSWPPDPLSARKLFMGRCRVVERDPATHHFWISARAALETAVTVDETSPAKHRLLTALDEAFKTLDTRDPLGQEFYASIPEAHAVLTTGVQDGGPPLDVRLTAVGHAHMDLAYLWPIAQIRRKNARTSSNVLRLMEAYPDLHFSQSQAQLYRYAEQDYPEIFARIKTRVAEGRWEVMGGMWVEPDLNIPGPESIVRQLVLGRRYFQKHFGAAETPVLFVPDTFGFPWSIPQLMQQAGLKWFVTNKLNWNQTNQLPASSHWWRGIDGTRILTHVLTTPRDVQYLPFPTNYKSDLTAPEVLGTWEQSTRKEKISDLPICFGYGDGGGGPTEDLILTARAYAEMPAMPQLKMGTIRGALEAIEADSATLPDWNGEHYLEGHRGVLTSQAWIKRANRQAEALLHEAEALSAMAGLRPNLTPAWELLCLNQFHDVLTGTAITEVFEDARRDHAGIQTLGEAAAVAAAAKISAGEGGYTVLNTAPLPLTRYALIPDTAWPVGQAVEGGVLVELPDLAPYSANTVPTVAGPPSSLSATCDGTSAVLENDLIRVEVAATGNLTRIYDKQARREVLPEGEMGNVLQAFEDRPVSWDAWDIDPFFEDRCAILDAETTLVLQEAGPLRATIRFERVFRGSTIRQDISLRARSKRIDFRTVIDWHETHLLLKVAFPVTVLAPNATFDIQWGRVERPTHRNTSWAKARFEVPAQKWADLSEGDYGVALLNDCKYGYDVRDHVIRLSLIKSPTMPDPVSDQGVHEFTYALLPHTGDWRNGVETEARDLNHPLRVVKGTAEEGPLVRCVAPNVVLETVKPSDLPGGLTLRLFEAHRQRGPVEIEVPGWVQRAQLTDLLEDPIRDLPLVNGILTLDLTPFQIATIVLT